MLLPHSGFALSALPQDQQGAQDTCVRLLCASQWVPADSAVHAMLAQRRDWLRRSAGTGVRTALLFASGWLVQWHEGTAKAVDAEWRRMASDRARGSAHLLHCSEGARSLQLEVQVASLHTTESATDVTRRVRAMARECAQGGNVSPPEIWQALCAPCQAASAGGIGFVGRRDVVAVASEDQQAVDLVRHFAQEQALRLAYQRYAGTDLGRADVGAAYVDIPVERMLLARVHALPRRALAAAAPMLGLRNVQALVLLLGPKLPRSLQLLEEVRRLLPLLEAPPVVVLAARSPELAALARSELRGVPGVRVTPVEDMERGGGCAALVQELLAARERYPR